MLSYDELERKFGSLHPGLDLVTVVPVAIPIHGYRVDMRIYEVRDYPLLNEYVLRAISIGINTVSGISDFLGIEESYVADAVATESSENGTIGITRAGNLILSDFGVEKLDNFTQNEARRDSSKLHVDLVTGKITKFRDPGVSPAELLKRLDVLEGEQFIRKLKSRSQGDKSLGDFNLDLVDGLISKPNMRKRLSVLEILDVNRSTKRPLYVLGQVLVFSDSSAENVMLNMTVDGERQEEHDQFLASAEIRDSLDFEIEPAAEEVTPASILKETTKNRSKNVLDLIEKITNLPEIDNFQDDDRQTSTADSPSPATIKAPTYLSPSIFRPQSEPVRLKVTDFPSLRSEAIRFSKSRLLIISPWAKVGVVNKDFIDQLGRALERGVKVDIALGIGKDFSDSHQTSISALVDLAKRNPEKFNLYKWKSHEKLLIADNAYIETTFNWLSFQGVTKHHYRRERGTLIVNSQIANEVYAEVLRDIELEKDPLWPN